MSKRCNTGYELHIGGVKMKKILKLYYEGRIIKERCRNSKTQDKMENTS